jgi:hypothetical protein
MAKELPYFKFEPAEYLTKNISFCSLSAQGLFVNICSYYWQRNCSLTKDQLLRRLNYETEFNELVEEGIIDLINDNISIKFLDAQLIDVELKSATNSVNGSKGGRPKKNPTETETKPNALKKETETISETKGIREDKSKEEEIKEILDKKKKDFVEAMKPHKQNYTSQMLNDFYDYWTETKPNSKLIRWEREKAFDMSRRLDYWSRNDGKFGTTKQLQKVDKL